jgi:hypothetical protein
MNNGEIAREIYLQLIVWVEFAQESKQSIGVCHQGNVPSGSIT